MKIAAVTLGGMNTRSKTLLGYVLFLFTCLRGVGANATHPLETPQRPPLVNITAVFPAPRRCAQEDSPRRPPICSVAILHFRRLDTPIDAFEVGFQTAVRHLEAQHPYRFTWVNLALLEGQESEAESICDYMLQFDHYWVKSNWDWIGDRIARQALWSCPVGRSLLISGSAPPPSQEAIDFYDALYYETHWYYEKSLAGRHPLVLHAFGIDTTIFNRQALNIPEEVEVEWDVVVASNSNYYRAEKATHRLLDKQGRRLLVGANMDRVGLEGSLEWHMAQAGVELQPMVAYRELAQVLCRSRVVYVPDRVEGGGERAVLEARALGVGVEVESDNPRLLELVHSPLYNHTYYAQQLAVGMGALNARQRGGGEGEQGQGLPFTGLLERQRHVHTVGSA